MLMSQKLLQGAHVHAVLQHQRGGGVPQLVGGILAGVQPCPQKAVFHHAVHGLAADAGLAIGEKERGLVHGVDLPAHQQIVVDGGGGGVVEVDDALFVALADDAQMVCAQVGDIEAHDLGDPQPAVEKNAQNAVIPRAVAAVNGLQQPLALRQAEIAGEGLGQLGGIQILHRVFLQQIGLDRQVLIKALDGRDLPRARGGADAVFRVAAALVLHPVPAQKRQVFIDLRQGDRADKVQVHVVDGDLLQLAGARNQTAVQLQKAEKGAQVKKILIYRVVGVPLDRLVVDEEITQNRRRVASVIHEVSSLENILFHFNRFRPVRQSRLFAETDKIVYQAADSVV